MKRLSKPFTAGIKVAIRLIGDPDCSAYVDLGDFKCNITLAPVNENVTHTLQKEVLIKKSKIFAAGFLFWGAFCKVVIVFKS